MRIQRLSHSVATLLTVVVFCTTANSVGECVAQNDSTKQEPVPVLIQSVNVFDGEQTLADRDVLLQAGVIKKIGTGIEAPESTEVIDGSGMTLLPGFIDSHVHAYFEMHLVQSAEFGVTTVLDMMGIPQSASMMRKAQSEGRAHHRADLYSAGYAVTVEGGHGTQFGFKPPVVSAAADVEKFVADRVREGSDYIKIIHEPGTAFGMSRPTLSPATLEAAVQSSHSHDKLAVAHVGGLNGATLAVKYGIDGLVHVFADEKVGDQLLATMVKQDVFVVPTTVVIQNVTGPLSVEKIIDDPNIAPYLTAFDIAGLGKTFPVREGALNSTENLHHNIATMARAGIKILAGTDAPNPGTTFGASMHHELELLTEIGLSNEQALAAATSQPADCFHLNDRGRIREGLRADVVLVRGNPMQEIRDTRNIMRIWKEGFPVDRTKRKERVLKEREKLKSNSASDDN